MPYSGSCSLTLWDSPVPSPVPPPVTPAFLGGQGGLGGCSPWSGKEWDTTERLN